MLTLRRLDAPGRRAYADALRPRVLVVQVRSSRRRFAWAVPMAPFEELLAFALALVLLVPSVLCMVPAGARGRWLRAFAEHSATAGSASGADGATGVPASLLGRLSLIAAGGLGEALRVPPGTPYLTVETQGVLVDVRSY